MDILKNIYVINLKSNQQRLEKIKKNFDKYNLQFNIFEAIDGKKLDKHTIKQYTTKLCRHFLCNKSMIGCAISHITLWKQLINDKHTNAYIILEDDAIINDDFIPIISQLDKMDIQFDVLNIFCPLLIPCFFNKETHEKIGNYQTVTKLFPISATGYIITKQGAQKLVNLIKKINYHIDLHIVYNQNNIIIKNICPNLIDVIDINDSSTSTNNQSLLYTLLDLCNFKRLKWSLSASIITLQMKYTFSFYILCILFLFIFNIFILKNKYIYLFTIIELILYFIFLYNK